MLMAYLRVLEARGWVRVPTTRGASFFVHGEHLLDRIQVFGRRWSHHRFDGTSWRTHANAHGDDGQPRQVSQEALPLRWQMIPWSEFGCGGWYERLKLKTDPAEAAVRR